MRVGQEEMQGGGARDLERRELQPVESPMGIYLGKVEHELREFHKPDLMSHRESRTYNGLHLAVENKQLVAESQPFVEQLMA